jgi:iron complex outermembrane recepter protein
VISVGAPKDRVNSVTMPRDSRGRQLRKSLCLAIGLGISAGAVAQPPPPVELIEVVGTTPLGGDLDTNRIAANVQTASAAELREKNALDLTDFMKRSMGSVFVNEAQSNPLQPDVQYRGFVGSPLLGLPQGLAVYQDGVRVNEPFGDTVSWALIPESAIESLYLVPGSNPLFGLNTLGGAIAVRTKDGFSDGDTRAEVTAGSFGRVGAQAEVGGTFSDELGYFVTASVLEEDGWRDYSPTDAQQVFAKLSSRGDSSRVDVSLTRVDTDLVGNGAAPEDLLELDRRAIFTWPDHTWNTLTMLGVSGEQTVSPTVTLRGNLYLRASDIDTLNGDDADFAECAGTPGFICEEENGGEELVLDENGVPVAADDTLIGGAVNRTSTEQDGTGFGLQADFTGELGGRENRFTVGVALDEADVEFGASTELGALDTTRQAVGGGVLVGERFTGLESSTSSTGFYLSNSFTFGERTVLTVSGRYNRTHVVLEDLLDDALDGDHIFERFNPAVGVTVGGEALTFYASYSEASRAPSPVELTCADEDDPCRLPNAFLADPPLEQVVARTLEAGVRGDWKGGGWHAGIFRTTNDDDILFISAGALTNEGFFDNVGKTRRDGFEANLAGAAGERLNWSLDYTYLAATFREDFVVSSPNHPAAVGGEIAVESGDRLPLIPQHLLKAGVRFTATEALTFGADVLASSGAFFRGDEGNLLDELDGYSVLGVRAEYRLGEHASVFASIDNLLDEEYETFGLFGQADEVLGPQFDEPYFVGPGAPRAAWIGFRIEL